MTNQIYTPTQHYKVLIRCNTYNQTNYIEDALNGFAMQRTNFPFLVYVIDDASTDGEQDVLRRWIINHCNHEDIKVYDNDLAIILMSKDKDSENCIYAIHLLKKNLYMKPEKQELHKVWRELCEYEAICEGDDYWTCPEKLQKQVDYLDDNPDCTLCYHAADIKFTEDFTGLRNIPAFCNVRNEYSFIDTIKGYPFQTATVVYRRELLDSPLYKKTMALGITYSKILFMVATHEGRVCGFNEKWSVYRKNNGGISNIIDTGEKAIERIVKYTEMAELFSPKEKKIMHNVYICYLIWESYILTPFSDSFFFKLVIKEARKSPSTAIKLVGRYIKRKMLLLKNKNPK